MKKHTDLWRLRVMIVVGTVAGILSIIGGARLLKEKNGLMF